MQKKIIVLFIIILSTAIPTHWIKNNTYSTQEVFNSKLYPIISYFLRTLWGKIPFSIGDIIYLLLIGWLLYLSLRLLLNFSSYWKKFIINISLIFSLLVFFFYSLWGYNYYKKPLKEQLNYTATYNEEELRSTAYFLLHKTNALQERISNSSEKKVVFPDDLESLTHKIPLAYEKASYQYRFLKYEPSSIKASTWSKILSYMGYSGYINPFTGEAQINKFIPRHSLPFTAAHEVGHQIGYSSEGDANFIAYLVLSHSNDIYFQYSAALSGLQYLLNDIRKNDDDLYEELRKQINQGVLLSYQESYQYWKSHQNPIEPVMKFFYDYFLKINNQTQGIQSYNLVSELIIAHHKKELL